MAQVPDWRAPPPLTNEFPALEDLRQVVVAAATYSHECGERVSSIDDIISDETQPSNIAHIAVVDAFCGAHETFRVVKDAYINVARTFLDLGE